MILVVDDLKTFPFPDDVEVVYARTLDDGFNFLCDFPEQDWDELWLDHDLGGEDTIRPLALMLADAAFNEHPWSIGKIVICSMNPVGRDWIESTLDRYYNVERFTDWD
jgi:hypothetical protein